MNISKLRKYQRQLLRMGKKIAAREKERAREGERKKTAPRIGAHHFDALQSFFSRLQDALYSTDGYNTTHNNYGASGYYYFLLIKKKCLFNIRKI